MNESDSSSAAEAFEAHPTSQRRIWLRFSAAIITLAIIAGVSVALRDLGRRHSPQGFGPLDSRSPAVNQAAPDFVLADPNGKAIKLSDLRGKVVLVNFWATWCIPCRQEMPAIAQVYNERRGQGFTALEVNEQESPEAIRAFTDQIGGTPPIALDRDGAVMRQYRLQGLPDSFLVDRQGVVHALSYGPVTPQMLEAYIDSAR
jgi:thiol-disulfide isomerase/thioredoxin